MFITILFYIFVKKNITDRGMLFFHTGVNLMKTFRRTM